MAPVQFSYQNFDNVNGTLNGIRKGEFHFFHLKCEKVGENIDGTLEKRICQEE